MQGPSTLCIKRHAIHTRRMLSGSGSCSQVLVQARTPSVHLKYRRVDACAMSTLLRADPTEENPVIGHILDLNRSCVREFNRLVSMTAAIRGLSDQFLVKWPPPIRTPPTIRHIGLAVEAAHVAGHSSTSTQPARAVLAQRTPRFPQPPHPVHAWTPCRAATRPSRANGRGSSPGPRQGLALSRG